MTTNRRIFLAGSLAAWGVRPLQAQEAYPSRPIRLVVPFAPGGSADAMGRLISERFGAGLGQPVVVDIKTGAGGVIGSDIVARAAPDGYTLLMASPPLTISPALYSKLPYKPEQIAPVALLGRVCLNMLLTLFCRLRVNDIMR